MADAPVLTRRIPWLAALFDFFVFPLGHVYAGRARRGFALWLIAMLGTAALLWTAMRSGNPVAGIAAFAVAFAVRLAVAADGFRVARRAPAAPPKRYQRPSAYVGIAVILVLVAQGHGWWLRTYAARAYRMPSGAMQPTLIPGDYIESIPGNPATLRRGTVVVYLLDNTSVVSRVMGLPGDTLEMRAKTLYVNGRALREPYARHIDPASDPRDAVMDWQAEFLARPARQPYRPSRDNWGPILVPAGKLFMLGDERDNSFDSRYLGFASRGSIEARPVWIYLSRDSAGIHWPRIGRRIR